MEKKEQITEEIIKEEKRQEIMSYDEFKRLFSQLSPKQVRDIEEQLAKWSISCS